MTNTFKKERKLTKKNQYDLVFKEGIKITLPEFLLFAKKNKGLPSRLGLIVTKRCIPKACERNRFKRLFRESFRCQNLDDIDVVVFARKDLAKLSNHELHIKLNEKWKKLDSVFLV